MARHLKKLRLVALVAITVFVTMTFFEEEVLETRVFDSQEQVFKQTLFNITPRLTEEKLSLDINIESFQNAAFIEADLTELLVLSLNETPVEQISWEVTHKQKHSKEGTLFIDSDISNVSQLQLSLFLDEELRFEWEL